MKDKLSVWVQWRNVSKHKILGKGNQDFKKYIKFKSIFKNLHIFLKIKALIQFTYK